MKLSTSVILVNVFYFLSALIFVSSICVSPCTTTTGISKSYFDCLKQRLYLFATFVLFFLLIHPWFYLILKCF